MYLVVNKDLKMKPGKMAAQVGHAVRELTTCGLKINPDRWKDYLRKGEVKVVLKASEEEIRALMKEWYEAVPVYDEGRTQIPSGSLTVLGFSPLANWSKVLSHLKLL